MIIKKIELNNFRNYENALIEFHPLVNLILGENGQGKTNLIEGLYLSSLGKSFRTSKDTELIKFNENYTKIKVECNKNSYDFNIDILISKEKKEIKVDKIKLKKMSELLSQVNCVVFSPEDLKIVKEDPEKRRKFINTELCKIKPSYYNNLSLYKKIIKQRNILLKEIYGYGGSNKYDEETLDIWNEKLIDVGSKIIIQRKEFIEKLKPISIEIYKKITQGKEELNIEYEPNILFSPLLEEQKKLFREALEKTFETDKKYGTTTKGPHKDDIGVFIENKDARAFGSQGQQKTAALALKLAEISLIKEETGENPVLLLDDIFSELDGNRQEFLIKSLKEVQLFITTTHISKKMEENLPKGKTFFIKNGKVESFI